MKKITQDNQRLFTSRGLNYSDMEDDNKERTKEMLNPFSDDGTINIWYLMPVNTRICQVLSLVFEDNRTMFEKDESLNLEDSTLLANTSIGRVQFLQYNNELRELRFYSTTTS